MSLKIKYFDIPEGAQKAAQVAGQGQPFADASSVALGAQDVAYATLESGGWPLNGSRSLLPDQPQGFWWSDDLSGPEGFFDHPPSLTFTFPSAYTATGLSFTFWPSTEEWCSEIRVTWYNGTVALYQAIAMPDAPIWTLRETVESFDKIHIEFLRTNMPGHFAKVQKIEIGQTYWFGQNEIMAVNIVNEIDPSLSELTVDTMRVDIRDRQNRGLVPQENQRMELYRNDSLYAVQYIVNHSRQAQQQYTFSCQSAIGLMEDDYMGGIYNAVPIKEVLDEVLVGFEYELHEHFAAETVTGYLPVCTRREALQQLAFSIGAIVNTQGGIIRIVPIPSACSTPFSKNKIFQGGKVETSPRVSRVDVVAHKYTQSEESEILLDAEEISGEGVLVIFDQPHHSYEISGGTITGSGANWVTITADGAVTLAGKKYLHSTTRHTQRNLSAISSERNNVVAVEEATLVHGGNAAEILKRLYQVSQLRQTITQDAVIADQRAGQKVTSENPWGGSMRGYITSMDSNLTPLGHTASVTILGAEVEYDAFLYAGELRSGNVEGLI